MEHINIKNKKLMKKYLSAIGLLILSLQTHADNGTGLIFLDEEQYRDIPLATASMMGTLPAKVDLSKWFPVPGNQGTQSSCVGWAVAYGLKSYQEAIERKQTPSSLSKVYSPSFVYNQIKLNSCGGGSYISDALTLLKKGGVASLESFPYFENNCTNMPSEAIKNQAKDFAIADWRRVNTQDDVEIKSQLNAGFPIVIGMMIDDGFQNLRMNQIYHGPSGKEKGGHAMVVVGYDDNKEAYKLFNSWGTDWGTSGFGWVSYNAFKNRVKEAYTAQDIVINNPNVTANITENNDRNVNIPPPISPQAISVSANLLSPVVTHNQWVQTPIGPQPGMIIRIPGNITNGLGAYGQLILRFYLPNGQPLLANPQESVYRDVHGLVAVGTQRGPIIHNPANLGLYWISIPYYALNFNPTGGMMTYQVNVQATLYINEYEKVKSQMTPMFIKY